MVDRIILVITKFLFYCGHRSRDFSNETNWMNKNKLTLEISARSGFFCFNKKIKKNETRSISYFFFSVNALYYK